MPKPFFSVLVDTFNHEHFIEEALVSAITSIRTVASQAAGGDDPWILSESTVDIAFAITRSGTISLGVDGELSDEVTHTLRLRLAPAA